MAGSMKRTKTVVALALLLTIVSSVVIADITFTNYESDNSALKVVLPKQLKDFAGLDGLRHSQALFGSPSYGGDKLIAGELFYVTPGLKTGCDDLSELVPKDVPPGTQMIFLVDRGNCDFVQKMRIAQKYGAVAVIIADNLCQCTDTQNSQLWRDDSTTGRTLKQRQKCDELASRAHSEQRLSPGETCEKGLPFMADDGTGGDVRIPSFLIDYLDAQPLKDCISFAKEQGNPANLLSGAAFACAANTKVVVSLEWDLPRKDNLVDWQLWSSSDSEGVFKKAFALTAKKLKDHTMFTPHYFLWDGAKWGCTVGELCATQCTKGGYYCNPDPDHELFSGVSGEAVVRENLRELCVWDYAKARNNTGLWWDYVTTFAVQCHPGSTPTADKFNQQCSETVQQSVGIRVADVQECVKVSWYNEKQNSKLDAELQLRANLKILQLPTAVVNGVLLRGGVTPLSILSSICAGFAAGKAPKLCSCVDRVNSDNLMECINSECAPDQKLCSRDKKCYSLADYAVACSDLCSKPTDKFCNTLSQCISKDQDCPECKDLNAPVYCPILKTCVESYMSCVPPTQPPSEKGTSAFGVFVITVVVVSIAGFVGYMFWRRQKAKLHDDVRAILSSYMQLEENDDSTGERVSLSRGSRRVEPAPVQSSVSSGGGGGASSIQSGGQDAASYI